MRHLSLRELLDLNRSGKQAALPSFCTANSWALDAIFDFATRHALPVLVEATCNQVNQLGGYTGMQAADYRAFVHAIANDSGYDAADVLFGGDHLGPNPWKRNPTNVALPHAAELVRSYVKAGFMKIHLDASMGCAGEGVLSPAEIAERTVQLCLAAEQEASAEDPPHYVIGTEVPMPGGETADMSDLTVTDTSSVAETINTHRTAFLERGLEDVWNRVIAVVTQPGVDFSHSSVYQFDPQAATGLAGAILDHPGIAYEAHSTDYQTAAALSDLVASHYVFLKVGPELTFAFREAILLLTLIEAHLFDHDDRSRVIDALMAAMDDDPQYWSDYYGGDERSVTLQKLFSYSDRIRYYWGAKNVASSVEKLIANLQRRAIPQTLISQYFPCSKSNASGIRADAIPRFLMRQHIQEVVAKYYSACGYDT
jgi:D-tagatose-1,6-bisphosphate aldolase subunit GatZ/KbaZ